MRHEQLLSSNNALLLVIDIQEKFVPHIHEMERVVKRTKVLIEAAKLLEVPVVVSQQYPQGLGETVATIRDTLEETTAIHDKTTFSCCQDDALQKELQKHDRHQVILAGIETHVCVAQTAFDLLASGRQPYIAVDAVSSRKPTDADVALKRLFKAGVISTTTEAAIMEMTVNSQHPAFRELSKLIK
jgi:nicotinamidase-related amidase